MKDMVGDWGMVLIVGTGREIVRSGELGFGRTREWWMVPRCPKLAYKSRSAKYGNWTSLWCDCER